jgi:catechol 2,3-dioxygenase-like lactoylglutathione lyase family enzyme
MPAEFPDPAAELTHILVVKDLPLARDFWTPVMGATVFREYGGSSCVLQLMGTWLLLVTGGGPTLDKPGVTFEPPREPDAVSHSMTIRVGDCRSVYEKLRGRGAEFLTPPVGSDWEVRAFFRDPDGHLLEISQAK